MARKRVVYSLIIHGAGTKLELPLMQQRVRARFPSPWLFQETMRSSVFLDHAKKKLLAAFNWMQNSFNGMQKLGADCKL